jgi:Asp-tRNA(Asn)/Glu-tRNA(Gln) amidotransferase A subunit family amidase
MGDLNYLRATAAARKLARREITAESLLSGCLELIAARERVVHAWTCIETDASLQRAWSLDAQGSAALLQGLPIGVTDLFDTFDLPTTYDSPIMRTIGPRWTRPALPLCVRREASSMTRR